MDYRALGELIFFSLIGLSLLIGVVGVTARLFFAPLIRDMIAAYRERGGGTGTEIQLQRVELRLLEMEDELRRLRSGVDFDRSLAGEADSEGE